MVFYLSSHPPTHLPFPPIQAQAKALENLGVSPSAFVLLNVPDSLLVERVVGRRTDPETGKIYHLKYR